MWWGSEFAPPAPGHDPLETMTDQDYTTPSDAELKTFACEWWNKFGFVKDKATCTWVIEEIDPDHFVDFSRDLLARWGK
jgi:hypothetical protein